MTTFHDFHIHHEPGDADATPLLLLHGTGGDERDLIAFGRAVAPRSPLLGLRGRRTEGPVTRWFRRHGEGVFDLPDLEARQAELLSAIEAAPAAFGFARPPVAIGYSNGANITTAMLMRGGARALSGAVLMRSMAGLEPRPDLDLAGLPVLMLDGAYDPLAPTASRSAQWLTQHGAQLERKTGGPGHELTADDMRLTRDWLARLPALTG